MIAYLNLKILQFHLFSVYFASLLVSRLSPNEFLLNCAAFYSLANLFLAHSTELSDWLALRRGRCIVSTFDTFLFLAHYVTELTDWLGREMHFKQFTNI